MEFPVRDTETDETTTIELNDVLFINVKNKAITFHTRDRVYKPLLTLSDYEDALKQHGFEKVENSKIINMNKATRFDKDTKIVFFDFDGYLTKGCYVSKRNLSKVKHLPEN